VVAAVAAAAAFTCRPAPGLGSLTYVRARTTHVVDLATCRDRAVGPASHAFSWGPFVAPNGRLRALSNGSTVSVRDRRTGRTRRLLRRPGSGVELLGWSPDSRWILFAVDPMHSASIAADGLTVQAVSTSGRVATIAPALVYRDYSAWCGRSFVLTSGGNRMATADKKLVVARPDAWRPRRLVDDPTRAWGSLVCAPGGRAVVVQSQRATRGVDMTVARTHWALWRVGLDGRARRLTSPPPGYSDDSPLFVGGTLFFVRSRNGSGAVYAMRGRRLLGPFASVGFDSGYYGHHAWPYSVSR
jgi:dipeptidyl aminopeptidase/acylaminoacyl peptidase